MTQDPLLTADVIVIGAGIAGLTTATAAAEAGLSVLLLEKTDRIGGSSAMSGGWFAFCGTPEQRSLGVEDSIDLFRADLLEVGLHRNDILLVDAYLGHQNETYRWLRAHGAVIRELEISSGQSAPRSHNTAIRDLLVELHNQFEQAGGRTLLNHRAQQLIRDHAGRVVAVDTDGPDGLATLHANRGIVLATGGFSRSPELLRIFAPEQLSALPYGGIGSTGDGLRMAWRLGAGLADMSAVSSTYGSHPDTGEQFHELLTAYYMGAIVVNASGRRFVNESLDYKTLGRAVLTQPGGIGFEIFDAKVRAQSHRGIPLKDMDLIEDLGHLHSADDLAGLAELAGIDPRALADTVAGYNTAILEGQQDELGRTGLCNGIGALIPIDTPPYYAYPAKPLMTSTYCGLTIDALGRVLDVNGEVIEGLSALGEVTGGFHGAAYMTGTSLGKGAVFGLIVARRLAEAAWPSAEPCPENGVHQ